MRRHAKQTEMWVEHVELGRRIPEDHLLRRVGNILDLGFVYRHRILKFVYIKVAIVLLSLPTANAGGPPSDFEAPNSMIGEAGWSGGLETWFEVAEVAAVDGERLRLVLRFVSDPRPEGGMFSSGWWCPLLEPRLSREAKGLRFFTLGGGQWYLFERPDGTFSSRSGAAVGKTSGEGWEIRIRGWTYLFERERLIRVVAPGGGVFEWTWGEGGVRAITFDGREIVRVENREVSGPWGRFSFGGSDRAWELTFPDGQVLKIEQRDFDTGETEMTVRGRHGSRAYRWTTADGMLLSDGVFRYEKRRTDMGEEVLHRIDRDGRTEWYTFDVGRGLATYKRQDGTRVMSWYFTEDGPLYMKAFRMDTISPEFERISTRRVEYDATGKSVREWTEAGSGRFPAAGDFRRIDLEEAKSLHGREGVVFIDARSAGAYERGHIPGAIRIGRKTYDEDYPQHQEKLRGAKTMVVYCTSRQCEDSGIVATRLIEGGHGAVLIFEGGWAEWWKSR